MTDDIVKRLRDYADQYIIFDGGAIGGKLTVFKDAADEIERLRAALRDAHQVVLEARLFRGYTGGPLETPFAERAERTARAALSGLSPREEAAQDMVKAKKALQYALDAINTGRSEPLFVARDLIKNTLDDLAAAPAAVDVPREET